LSKFEHKNFTGCDLSQVKFIKSDHSRGVREICNLQQELKEMNNLVQYRAPQGQ